MTAPFYVHFFVQFTFINFKKMLCHGDIRPQKDRRFSGVYQFDKG